MTQICSATAAQLLAGLTKVQPAIGRNSVVAIIESVHVRIVDKGLLLTATNLSTTISTGIPATGYQKREFMFPRPAMEIIKKLPADTLICFYGKDDDPTFIDVRIENSITSHFTTEDPKEFPKIDSISDIPTLDFTLPQPETLKGILDACIAFTTKDDTRPAMTGVLLSKNMIAATDAHKLIVVDYEIMPDLPDYAYILPKDCIASMAALDAKKPWLIKTSPTLIVMTDKITKIISRHINANFPQVKVVVPEHFEFTVQFDKSALLNNIAIAQTCSNKTSNALTFTLKENQYQIAGADVDYGYEAEVLGKCTWDSPEPFQFQLDAKNFLTLLSLVDGETLDLKFNKASAPFVISEGAYTLLVMPLMLHK